MGLDDINLDEIKGNVFICEHCKDIWIGKPNKCECGYSSFTLTNDMNFRKAKNSPIIELPYIKTERIIIDKRYNPHYGDNRNCECGHSYERHFDSYENMDPIGCKYCRFDNFKEKLKDE